MGSAVTTVSLLAAGCSAGYDALGTQTAQVRVNGNVVAERTLVTCDQVQWVWFIESAGESPGFTAQVRTGDTVAAELVRLEDLGGFTGSSWNATVATPSTPSAVGVDAEVADGTFVIVGTAMGWYQNDPAEIATAGFEIRTDC